MKDNVVSRFTVLGANASLAVEGRYSPDIDCIVTGIVTVRYTGQLPGTFQIDGRLRAAEASVASDILAKLASFDSIVAERDALLAEKDVAEARFRSVAGYSTAEIMLGEIA